MGVSILHGSHRLHKDDLEFLDYNAMMSVIAEFS
jgi:hypothetical protein